jgi:hypothetical protein
MPSRWPLAALLVLVGAGCGRHPPARSAEEAYLRLLEACDKGDPALLFDAFDTPTLWAIETVHKSQREMRQLIVASYPVAERDRALGRLPAACQEELELPRRYYRRLDDSAAALDEVRKRLYAGTGQPIGTVRAAAGTADVWREGGSIFHFGRDGAGRWGYMELRELWERAKERALHEVETVRHNAALYDRQRPPAAKGAG